MSHRRFGTILVMLLLLGGCRTVRQVVGVVPQPDLARIYAGTTNNPGRNPVVVIPGFAGSELVRKTDGKIVWGAFFTSDAVGYGREEGFRGFALDLAGLPDPLRPRDLVHVDDDSRATTPLARVRAEALVTDVSFQVYGALLELLENAGYRIVDPETFDPGAAGEPASDGIRADGADADDARPLCFSFPYDWRQDGVTNAIALGRFLERAEVRVRAARRRAGIAEEPVRFDLVAHSMGGLIARYFLRYGARDVLGDTLPPVTWDGAEIVDRLILVSTPSFGSMKVLRDLVQGRGHPVLPRFHPTLAATLVSAYQLLPRPRHRLWHDDSGEPIELALYDVATWRANSWGPFADGQERFRAWLYPETSDDQERLRRLAAFMAIALERARQFARALDQRPAGPPPTYLVLFAGDTVPTLDRVLVNRRDGRLELVFEGPDVLGLESPGDGTVSRASALADERLADDEPSGWLRSPIPWSWTFFVSDKHTAFLANPSFQNNLLHLLLELPPPRREAPSPR